MVSTLLTDRYTGRYMGRYILLQTCAYTLEVMAGTFLGVAGASKPDTAGIVMVRMALWLT